MYPNIKRTLMVKPNDFENMYTINFLKNHQNHYVTLNKYLSLTTVVNHSTLVWSENILAWKTLDSCTCKYMFIKNKVLAKEEDSDKYSNGVTRPSKICYYIDDEMIEKRVISGENHRPYASELISFLGKINRIFNLSIYVRTKYICLYNTY